MSFIKRPALVRGVKPGEQLDAFGGPEIPCFRPEPQCAQIREKRIDLRLSTKAAADAAALTRAEWVDLESAAMKPATDKDWTRIEYALERERFRRDNPPGVQWPYADAP